jgi:antitoxin component of MazEF toxin-antitoxin module
VQPSQLLATANVKPDEQVVVVVNAGQRIGYTVPEGKRELRILDKFQRRLIRKRAKERTRAKRRAERFGDAPLVLTADEGATGGGE